MNKEQPLSYHQEVELYIERLTNLGQGVGRHEGFVVMVPGVIPGERVRAQVYRCFASYAVADLLEVLEASADRIKPRCELFGACGGCQYQMMRYEAQLDWKREHVEDCLRGLRKQGYVFDPVEPTQASPESFGYRSKLTPHYGRLQAGNPEGKIGFLRVGSTRMLVDVPQCPIARPKINVALPALREHLRASGTRRGGTLLLRESLKGVETQPKAIVQERVGNFEFSYQAGDFFQNNPHILPKLVEYVVQAVKEAQTSYLIDAYCGSGLFAISCAPHVSHCLGIEISETAIRFAQQNAQTNKQHHCRFIAGRAEAIFKHVSCEGSEATLIIDPPRKGCDEAFLEQLFALRPKRLVYVSCDPATQARDLQACLAQDYHLTRVRPFDLFPQTRHVESVAILDALHTDKST